MLSGGIEPQNMSCVVRKESIESLQTILFWQVCDQSPKGQAGAKRLVLNQQAGQNAGRLGEKGSKSWLGCLGNLTGGGLFRYSKKGEGSLPDSLGRLRYSVWKDATIQPNLIK